MTGGDTAGASMAGGVVAGGLVWAWPLSGASRRNPAKAKPAIRRMGLKACVMVMVMPLPI